MDDPMFIDELREKLSRTLQTYQTTHERACTIVDSVHNNISTVVSNLSNVEKTMVQVNNRMLDQRVDSGETSFNGKTDSDSDKTDSDSDKTAESTPSPSRVDYFHGKQFDYISSVVLDQNPHMLLTSVIHKSQEDFAEILNTRGVPIEDQSDTISKSLLKADYIHFESGCSRTLHVDTTQRPRNTMDMAQSPSNPMDTTQGPRNSMDMAQSPSNPVDTAQRPSKKWFPLGLGGVLLTFLLLNLNRKKKPSSSSYNFSGHQAKVTLNVSRDGLRIATVSHD